MSLTIIEPKDITVGAPQDEVIRVQFDNGYSHSALIKLSPIQAVLLASKLINSAAESVLGDKP